MVPALVSLASDAMKSRARRYGSSEGWSKGSVCFPSGVVSVTVNVPSGWRWRVVFIGMAVIVAIVVIVDIGYLGFNFRLQLSQGYWGEG